MTRIRAAGAALLDSPCLNWDILTMFSAWRLGAWFLLLNIMLGSAMVVGLNIVSIIDFHSKALGHLGLGQFMAAIMFIVIAGSLTVFVPIRVAGLLDGPRWGRYFDQIVMTGISPARYMAGKILAMNAFFLLVLTVTLPYMIFAMSLGGVRPLYLISGGVALLLYTNLLTMVTLTGSIFISELFVVPVTIFCFMMMFLQGLAPVPPVVNVLVPSGYFIAPLYEVLNVDMADVIVFVIQLPGYPISLGAGFFFFVVGLLALALLYVFAMLGPLHCIGQANGTFGEVVMPGDAKRKSAFRRRLILRRRSEICFFYENRSDWLVRWELPLRWAATGALLLASALVGFGGLHMVGADVAPFEFMTTNMLLLFIYTLGAAFLFCTDMGTDATVVCWGTRRFRAGTVDWVVFSIFFLMLSIVSMTLPLLREFLGVPIAAARSTLGGGVDNTHVWTIYLLVLPYVWLIGFGGYATIRLVGPNCWSKIRAFLFGAALYFGILCFGPLVSGVLMNVYLPAWPAALVIRKIGTVLSYVSPLTTILVELQADLPKKILEFQAGGTWITILLHVPISVGLCGAAIRRCRTIDPRSAV